MKLKCSFLFVYHLLDLFAVIIKQRSPYEFVENEVQILKDCPAVDQDQEFCLVETVDGQGQLDGTIGGMIFDSQGAQKVLTGISFRRQIPVSNKFVVVYSRVEPYLPWILSVIKKN